LRTAFGSDAPPPPAPPQLAPPPPPPPPPPQEPTVEPEGAIDAESIRLRALRRRQARDEQSLLSLAGQETASKKPTLLGE
jgi:hypothetical protein